MADDDYEVQSRPSPDALLENANREARGRLKIFLGAAPGVGKTYEMLMAGRARKAEGIDVVIGVVETHGRSETQALVEGFEVVPRAPLEYKGRRSTRWISTRFSLAVPHWCSSTNWPTPTLLAADILNATWMCWSFSPQGIDVYTTLNIQHVESLNDVVAQITRVRVRETVPDSVIDRADDIEIIDLTPDDLIKRLHEGKVYLPAPPSRRSRTIFRPAT